MNANLAYVYDEEVLVEQPLFSHSGANNLVLFEQYETEAASPDATLLEDDDTCCNLYLIPA